MSSPFDATELDDAKFAFAQAFQAERVRCAGTFETPDTFRAALTIWNEENAMLPRALWVAHVAKWTEDPDVIAHLDDFAEEAEEEVRNEKAAKAAETKTPEYKEMLRLEIMTEMREIMKGKMQDAKDRISAADRLAKLANLDEKPVVDPTEGQVLGIIHHRLAPMDAPTFEAAAAKQQADLQHELIELTANDATLIN